MAFVCDAHVHLYLGYDLVPALRAASTRLDLLFREACGDLSAQPVRICCLAERFDCHYFRDLREGRLSLNAAGAQCRPCAEDGGLCLTFADGEQLILIAGRQINTVERLEVIALGASPEIADHALSFGAAAAAIRDAGGIPVINWAPGKWFFSRGRLVRQIIDSSDRLPVVLCDTTLRPDIWPEPLLMRYGAKNGVKIIAGSDPLPLPGEELRIGTYGIAGIGSFDASRPVSALKEILLQSSGDYRIAGRRSSALAVMNRIFLYSLEKRRSKKKTAL